MIGIILATGVYMIIRNGIVIWDGVFLIRPLILTLVLGAVYFGSRKIKKGGIAIQILVLQSHFLSCAGHSDFYHY